ncbi:hypothetical protein CEXT_489811 [Caerostris extrusa]|uniref:Uncharacterized protein n=1 Tax=Caerostris extrusa TaxID=172846 RepID=A0AAV4YEE0_CAEEX|nr:hypothetical protein CEXT_489811 [Caerostris extrusa]
MVKDSCNSGIKLRSIVRASAEHELEKVSGKTKNTCDEKEKIQTSIGGMTARPVLPKSRDPEISQCIDTRLAEPALNQSSLIALLIALLTLSLSPSASNGRVVALPVHSTDYNITNLFLFDEASAHYGSGSAGDSRFEPSVTAPQPLALLNTTEDITSTSDDDDAKLVTLENRNATIETSSSTGDTDDGIEDTKDIVDDATTTVAKEDEAEKSI